MIHSLDNQLTQPLGGSHNIGGVHRFIGADHNEFPAAVAAGGQGGLIGAEHVVLNGLAGAGLHQRHMLMGGRMIDDIRVIGGKHLLQFSFIPHGSDQRHQIQLGIVHAQLLLDLIGVILVNIKYNQLLWIVPGHLAAQLRPDGAAAAGNQHHLILNIVQNLVGVDLNGLPPQQILHRHVLQIADRDFTGHQLIDSGQNFQLAAGLFADIQNIPLLLR